MERSRFAILGGGMVAGYAAKQLVELGLNSGDLTIISADTTLPYERPPLSKGFLAGRDSAESILINPKQFYQDHGIEIHLKSRVAAIDPARKRLTLTRGDEFEYERLVLATGARPRTLTIPGADLANVFYLRSMDDSKAIQQRINAAKRAAVIGGGFIGMEVASVLAQKKIETTMIFSEDRVCKQSFTPEMSRFFETYFTARGVRLVKGATIKKLTGDSVANGVELADGNTIACDLIVAGIGAIPNTELFAESGIAVENGVIVNEFLETNHSEILAAGDIASYPDMLFGKRRRAEHWDNAVSQGQHCAKILMGDRAPFRHVPYFFSDVFDLSYEFWGDPAGAEQVVDRGDVNSNSFSVWWIRQKKLVAAFAMNRPDEERDVAPKWIESSQAVNAGKVEKSASITAAADA